METTPDAPVLIARDLLVRRGGRALLDRAGIELLPGRVTAVVGPNGAGKSTLLRVLSGEIAPDAGWVRFHGRGPTEWSAAELARRRAVLPQESDLRFPFRVEEVVRLGRTPHPGAGETARDRMITADALARVGLTALADRIYPTLSGGERQRVQLARVLAQLASTDGAHVPGRVMLLDEPTSALDLAHQIGVLELARRLARDEGVAVLAVLHDLNLALACADDVTALKDGRVFAAGPAADTLTPSLVAELFGVGAERVGIGAGARLLFGAGVRG